MFLTADLNNATIATPVYASTPLIYYPQELAYQISVVTYIHIGCLAVMIWEVIDNLKGDFKLLFRYKISLPTCIYFTSRIILLAYMLVRAVLLTLPVANCAKMYDALNALLIVFASATTAMPYLRVCAVYCMRRSIVVVYGLLWLCVIGMIATTVPRTFTAAHIAETQYCGEVMHGRLLGLTWTMFVVNNVLIYGAIAYRIFTMFPASDSLSGSKLSILLTFGTALPIVSRALFKGTQSYFVTVLITNPILIACVYAFEFGAPARVMFLVCHLVIVNILSCRVYRNIKMGLMADDAMAGSGGVHGRSAVGALVFRHTEAATNHQGSGATILLPAVRTSTTQSTRTALASNYSTKAVEGAKESCFGDVEKTQDGEMMEHDAFSMSRSSQV